MPIPIHWLGSHPARGTQHAWADGLLVLQRAQAWPLKQTLWELHSRTPLPNSTAFYQQAWWGPEAGRTRSGAIKRQNQFSSPPSDLCSGFLLLKRNGPEYQPGLLELQHSSAFTWLNSE